MKRILAFILALFYITLTSGAYINIHYCGGDIQSVDLGAQHELCCCGMDYSNSSCCENEIVQLKIDVDQDVVFVKNINSKLFLSNIISNSSNELTETVFNDIKFNDIFIPPPKSEHIWLINCTLIFYG